jgi:hypothetical protein
LKFAELEAADLQYLAIVHKNTEIPYDQRIDILKNKFQVSERTVRKWLAKAKISKYEAIDNEQVRQGKLKGLDSSKKIKLISWAQNATPVNAAMLKNMEVYAKFLDAEIIVIQGRYMNPTSLFSEKMESAEWWDTSIIPYMVSSRLEVHKNLDILGNAKTQATAENPLSGYEGLTKGKSCIIGHSRLHLKSLPVLEGRHGKLMMTTGAVTMRNYTDTKAGIKGSFNHVYGFVIVEIKDDEIFYVRQVPVSSDGTFTDLIYHVDDKVTKIKECASFVMGDIHVDDVEEEIVAETVRYFKKIRPEKVILHDVVNGTSANHHEAKDPILSYLKFKEGKNVVKDEIDRVIGFIKKFKLTDYSLYSVSSNHNDWFDRWVKEGNWKHDLANAETYMEYALAMLQGKTPNGIIAYLLQQEFGDRITCTGRNESLEVHGFELSQHGDIGSNGSKGSIEGFRRLNTKMQIGHCHSIQRLDGVLTAGTYTKKRLPYNKGASDWGWCGIVTHTNGKAQQLIFQKDKKCSTLF